MGIISVFKAPSIEIDIEFTVKRSRFIGSVRAALTAKEANEKIKKISAEYPKATHHCWGYRIGLGNVLEHCSDNGEPSGTAGKPILGAIKRCGLENTLIVVTRYFGGIKLGVRGLIDAYTEAAALAAEAAHGVEMEFNRNLSFVCGYDLSKTIITSLDKWGFTEEKRKIFFSENIEINLDVPYSKLEEIKAPLEEMQARGMLSKLQWGEIPVVREKWN